MARRTARFEQVQAILPKMIQSLGVRKEYKARLIQFYWAKIVGREIADHVHPVRVSFRTLFLSAESPAWANQIMLMQLDMIHKINQYIGETLIQELRFCSPQEGGADVLAEAVEAPDRARALRSISLAPEELSKARQKCAPVHDQDLRRTIERIYQKQLRLEKLEKERAWHACAHCGALCAENEEYCSVCAREMRQETERKIRRFLADMPWARYSDVYAYVKCTPDMVNKQRVHMMQKLAAHVMVDDTTSLDAKTLVMLYRSLPPEQLTDEILTKTLYRLRYDLRWPVKFKPKKRYETIGRQVRKKKE